MMPIYVPPFAATAIALCQASPVYALSSNSSDVAEEDADSSKPSDAAPYVDRLIADGNLEPLIIESDQSDNNFAGNPRSLSVELGGSLVSHSTQLDRAGNAVSRQLQGDADVAISASYQSDNLGLLQIEAQLHRGFDNWSAQGSGTQKWQGLFSLSSRNLPLGDGWLADGMLGVTRTPTISLIDRQMRFYLPSSTILGASAVFKGYRKQTTLSEGPYEPFTSFNLSVGEPGLLGGLRRSGFSGLSGVAASAGGQMRLAPRWTTGVQAIAVENIQNPYASFSLATGAADTASRITAQSAVGAITYADSALQVQANAIWSRHSLSNSDFGLQNQHSSAGGMWIDAGLRVGKSFHSAGIYYFGSGLHWGSAALFNNVRGGYYRLSAASQRWRSTFNLDIMEPVDGTAYRTMILHSDLRRQINFDTLIGLNSSVRLIEGRKASQFLAFVDFASKPGSTRVEVGWTDEPQSRLFRAGVNQSWTMPSWAGASSRLNTQLGFERGKLSGSSNFPSTITTGKTTNGFSAAISGGLSPFAGASIDANIAYNSNGTAIGPEARSPINIIDNNLAAVTSQRGRSFSAAIVASLRLSRNWSISASYTDTTSSLRARYGLTSAIHTPAQPGASAAASSLRDLYHLRAGFLTLRYMTSAGLPKPTLGYRQFPVGGTGSVEGRVYYDTNDSRKREPAEAGVAGIRVILDGIHAVRTDQSGYYRFDDVADGPHLVTVDTDSLPLPWNIAANDQPDAGLPYAAQIDVDIRSTTILDIAAGKP